MIKVDIRKKTSAASDMREIRICTYKPEYAPQTYKYLDDPQELNEILGRCWWTELNKWCFEALEKVGIRLVIFECWSWQDPEEMGIQPIEEINNTK